MGLLKRFSRIEDGQPGASEGASGSIAAPAPGRPAEPEPVPDEGIVSVRPVEKTESLSAFERVEAARTRRVDAAGPTETANGSGEDAVDYEWVDPDAEDTASSEPDPVSEVDETVEVEAPAPITADTDEVDSEDEAPEEPARPKGIDPKLAEIRRRDAEAIEPERRLRPDEVLTPQRRAEDEEADDRPVAQVIAFANQKGGVAKTTTTLNLAVAFKESGHRVLCVDMDPQGNLTMSQGVDPDKVETSIYDVLVHGISIKEAIQEREIDVAVASIDLAGAEIAMSAKIGRERALQKALDEVKHDYDFVCIDTPPSLGLLTVNALTAAQKVIVPVQCEYLSMRGLVQLQNTLTMIRENLNPDVVIEGILPTMMDTRTVHAKEAIEILEENFGDLVFKSRIRKTIKFAEAPVRGSSVLKYDPDGKAAGYYRKLAEEVLTNGA